MLMLVKYSVYDEKDLRVKMVLKISCVWEVHTIETIHMFSLQVHYYIMGAHLLCTNYIDRSFY